MKIDLGVVILILAIVAVIVLGQGGIANVSETVRMNTGWKLDFSLMKQIFQPVIDVQPAPVTVVQTQTDPGLLELVEQTRQQNEELRQRLDKLSERYVIEEAVKGALSGAVMAGSGSPPAAQEPSVEPADKEPAKKSSKGFTLPNPFNKLFGIFK